MGDSETRCDEPEVRPAQKAVDTGRKSRVHPIRPDEELCGDDRRHETAEPALLHLVEERIDRLEHLRGSRPLEPIHERRRVGDEPTGLRSGS
jgi:hypothetical protein